MSKAKSGAAEASQAEVAATEAVETETTETQIEVVRHDPIHVNTDWGAVAVFGHEQVSKQELLLLAHCLNDTDLGGLDHGVRSVILITDGYPMKDGAQALATCDVDAGAVMVNLMETFSKSMEACINDDTFSVLATWHHNMALNFLHEIHHLSLLANDDVMRKGCADGDETIIGTAEELAVEWSELQLYALAKVADIEPSHIAESPFLATQVMEMLKDDDSDFAKQQRHMLENHIMFFKAGDEDTHELTLHTFKDVCHRMSGDALDDPAWLAGPTVAAPAEPTMMEQAVAAAAGQPVAELPQTSTEDIVPVPEVLGDDPEMDTSFADYCDEPPFDPGVEANGQFTPAPAMAPATAPIVQPAAAPMSPAANMAPAGTAAPMAAAPPAQTPVHPPTGLTPEQTKAVVLGVYEKCVNHIFTMCGRPHAYPDYDANPGDGGAICNANNVSRMGIPLTDVEKAVVVKMDCADANGKWCPNCPTSGGELRGWVTKNAKIPMYKLYINVDGFEVLRTIIPQNPNKGKNAAQAQAGNRIVYVFDGADKAPGANGDLKLKFENGTWTEINR